MSVIEEIKKRVSLLQVVSEHVVLTENNGRFAGKCPFHNESNASFTVNVEKGLFHCYGCQARGDVIEFVEKIEGFTKAQAIQTLAKQAGISGTNAAALTKEEKAEFRIIKGFAAVQQVYAKQFWASSSPAAAYMHSRGLTQETLKKFGVGYAPGYTNAIFEALGRVGITKQEAVESGLLAWSRKNQKEYDPMFGRVVFPISSAKGVVGFGGRLLKDQEDGNCKYKNTSLSPIFQKGNHLFGLAQAQKAIRQTKTALAVEGYIDVLSMHQAGFANCVGTMGTAITVQQLELLALHCTTLILLLDGDIAGQKAMLRTLDLALHAGFIVKIVRLPHEEDPDSFVRKENGPQSMQQLLDSAECGLEVWMNYLETQPPAEQSVWIRSFLLDVPDKLLQVVWAKRLAAFLGVTTQTLLSSLDSQA